MTEKTDENLKKDVVPDKEGRYFTRDAPQTGPEGISTIQRDKYAQLSP